MAARTKVKNASEADAAEAAAPGTAAPGDGAPEAERVPSSHDLLCVLYSAQYYAQMAGAAEVAPAHLLIACLSAIDPGTNEPVDSTAALILGLLDVGVAYLADRLKMGMGVAQGGEPGGEPPYDKAASAILRRAAAIAARGGKGTPTDSCHLLVAITEADPPGSGSATLLGMGVKPDLLYSTWKEMAHRHGGGNAADVSGAYSGFTTDLTMLARAGTLDPVIGRDAELDRIVTVLMCRTRNNAALIGESGVGKTALAEGLAARIVAGDVPPRLRGARLLSLDTSRLVAGAEYTGQFESRVIQLLEDIERHGDTILFLDELHRIVATGGHNDGTNLAGVLKPALARGAVRCLGATTHEDYRQYVETDAALRRRFEAIEIAEPTAAQARAILDGLAPRYGAHHGLSYSAGALDACVGLSERYIPEGHFPDRAIGLMDEAGSGAAAAGRKSVEAADVVAVVARRTGLSAADVDSSGSEALRALPDTLAGKVIGQDAAVRTVSGTIRARRLALSKHEGPLASFVFVGPAGVGKTVMARTIADACTGGNLVSLDLSAYSESHSASDLFGAPPGYGGYDSQPGRLVEPLRRNPSCVVLLEHADQAHPVVIEKIADILRTGEAEDTRGARASYRDAVVVMTVTESGDGHSGPLRSTPGFAVGPAPATERSRLADRLTSSVADLVDAVVVFPALSVRALEDIVSLSLAQVVSHAAERGVEIEILPSVAQAIVRAAPRSAGARPLRRLVDSLVEQPIAAKLLAEEAPGRKLVVSTEGDVIAMRSA